MIEIIENTDKNDFWPQDNTNLFLMKSEWINTLLNQEQLPCHIFRVDLKKEKTIFNNFYNLTYMKLIGVIP